MIKINNIKVDGIEAAVRGMRNPMDSWSKSDSKYVLGDYHLGEKDLDLMIRLAVAGTEHRKFLRMIHVSFDLTLPLFVWKEFDTYKIGTTVNSCSTMHTIHKNTIAKHLFSMESLDLCLTEDQNTIVENYISLLEDLRNTYLETKDKKIWRALIELLPSSFNQKRTIDTNLEVLINMIHQRKNHKLYEWNSLIDILLSEIPLLSRIFNEIEYKKNNQINKKENKKKTRSKILILDSGHSLETPGKRTPKVNTRNTLFNEGKDEIIEIKERQINDLLKLSIEEKLATADIDNFYIFEVSGVVSKERSLPDRIYAVNKICNEHKTDSDILLISLHHNASDSFNDTGFGEATGIECYYYEKNNETKNLSEKITKDVSSSLGVKNRGAKANTDFYILKNSLCDAILYEGLFMNSSIDIDKILYSKSYYDKTSDEIVKNIIRYFNK